MNVIAIVICSIDVFKRENILFHDVVNSKKIRLKKR